MAFANKHSFLSERSSVYEPSGKLVKTNHTNRRDGSHFSDLRKIASLGKKCEL